MRLLRSTYSDFGHWGGGVDVHLRYFQSDFGETRWVSWCWGNPQVMVIHDWMMIWGPMTYIFISLYIILCIYIYSMFIYISCWPWRPILVEEICVLPLWIPIRSIEYLQVDPTCCVFEVGLLPKNSLPKGQHLLSPKKRCSNYCSWCWCFNQAVVDDVQTGFMFLFNMGPPSCKLVYNPI